ncbi:MAG: hypothetical protein QOE97_2973 [Pseudonocardiales bacterium]|jgi:ABC-type phosphate transport system substrate-binding protein|nr:hypothetical protein [Pseudonocardiales bacterium]
MVGRKFTLGMGMVVAAAATVALFPATNAVADYAPTSNDVVGVGSDTLQQLGDFVADGDFTGNPGYNSAGNKNKFISIDATADANTRLSYGVQGVGGAYNATTNTGGCAPGTGGTKGSGNQNVNHTDTPCVQNPSIVLRAKKSPVQRPNGSGAGFNLLVQDTNTSTGLGKGWVDFARASSPRTPGGTTYDSVTVGVDKLAMLSSDTTTTNAAALTLSQITSIYNCSVTHWNELGGSFTSTDSIVPLVPQVGSGTRSSFLGAISVGTPGPCVQNVEENDPEAIQAAQYITYTGTSGSVTQAGAKGAMDNAIEPMSQGRLNLFQGKLSDGTGNGVGGYFKDPSCPFAPAISTANAPQCTTGATLAPNVTFWSAGWNTDRNLYIYFRHQDFLGSKKFQPGGSLNWIRTMLYNPCPNPGVGDPTCTVDPVSGREYGPGGAPWIASGAGQANISASGIVPAYAFTPGGA